MSIDTGDFNNDLIPDIYIAGRTGTFMFNQEAHQDVPTPKLFPLLSLNSNVMELFSLSLLM